MRKIGLAVAVLTASVALGTSSAQAFTANPLDALKQRAAANNCTALGGKPSPAPGLGIDCEYVANLNISRQILAGALCGALGWQFLVINVVPFHGEYVCSAELNV